MANKFWWLIHKDLVVEYRMRQTWPQMILLGALVAVVFNLQLDLPQDQQPAAAGSLLVLAILFAGIVVFERTFAVEQHDDCWDALKLYPLPPSIIFLAKLTINFLALTAVQFVLVPLFTVLTDVPLWRHVWPMAMVAVLGNMGMASIGTIAGALSRGVRQQGALLALLVLPLLLPVMLAASEAARLIGENDLGHQWWLWVQFLGCYAVVFSTLGTVLFGFLLEE